MPKNPNKTAEEVLNEFNEEAAKSNLRASINKSNQKEYKNEKPVNKLFELLYGIPHLKTSVEKAETINRFFADLFDGNSIRWTVKTKKDNGTSEKLEELLTKYLKMSDFSIKLWQAKLKSGSYGRYGFLILKEDTGTKRNGINISRPNIIPVRIIYKNVVNEHIVDIEIDFEGYTFGNGKTLYYLKRRYFIKDKKVALDRILVDSNNQKILYDDIPKELADFVNKEVETLDFGFIPISVLKNDYEERSRTWIVDSRLRLIDNFDENLAILPSWERGGIAINSSPVTPQNQEMQDEEFMKALLLCGLVRMKPLEVDGNMLNLSENLMIVKPTSNMQTTKATRDLIWNEIKEDLGLPSLNEVKSAQKTSAEVIAKQFLTSPIIEREKVFMKSFLKDFGAKFISILSTCTIEENMSSIDPEDLEVEVEFDVTTDKNINETIKIMTDRRQDTSTGGITNA